MVLWTLKFLAFQAMKQTSCKFTSENNFKGNFIHGGLSNKIFCWFQISQSESLTVIHCDLQAVANFFFEKQIKNNKAK